MCWASEEEEEEGDGLERGVVPAEGDGVVLCDLVVGRGGCRSRGEVGEAASSARGAGERGRVRARWRDRRGKRWTHGAVLGIETEEDETAWRAARWCCVWSAAGGWATTKGGRGGCVGVGCCARARAAPRTSASSACSMTALERLGEAETRATGRIVRARSRRGEVTGGSRSKASLRGCGAVRYCQEYTKGAV